MASLHRFVKLPSDAAIAGVVCRPRPTPESFILSLAPSRLRKDIGDRRLRLVALVLSQALKDAAQLTRRTVLF